MHHVPDPLSATSAAAVQVVVMLCFIVEEAAQRMICLLSCIPGG